MLETCTTEGSPVKNSAQLLCFRLISTAATAFLAYAALWPPPGCPEPTPAATEQLGKVDFPTSCTPAAQPIIEKGVALLHSFQYLQSQNTFTEAIKQDPNCAMAHWGKAMSLYHQIWDFPMAKTLKEGHKEIEKARKLKNITARERGFLEAAAAFYIDSKKLSREERTAAYSAKLENWYAEVPGDIEVGSFYALSLISLAELDDSQKGVAVRQKAIHVLHPLFQEHPDHPGVAHYLIHAADEQGFAEQGLGAARRYAAIAPDSSHAIHMPSHIFVRLGMWQDSITSNIAAQAAGAHAAEMHQAESHYQTHAMDFLNYSYLQCGQEAKARDVIMDMHHVVGADEKTKEVQIASLNERMSMELRHWSEAAQLPGKYNWARAIGAARSGDAKAARAGLAKLEDSEKHSDGYSDDQPASFSKAEAWVLFAEGKSAEGLKELRAAADKEDANRLDSLSISAREMLGDMLFEAKQPAEALREYQTALRHSPNRFNLLLGAARAANAAGQPAEARASYRLLLEMCGSSGDRAELAEARNLVAKN
jgi:Tfp pilus assembly protein PilF